VEAARQAADRADGAGDLAGTAGAYRLALEAQAELDCRTGPGTADLLGSLGWAEYRSGQLGKAEEHLLAAKDILATAPRPEPVLLAQTLDSLGVVQRDLGHYEAAELGFGRALEVLDAPGADDPRRRAAIHNDRAGLWYYRGEYRLALDDYRTALRLQEARGASPSDVAQVLNNIGLVRQELGDFPGAREDLLRALAMKEASSGPDQPTTAGTVENLAQVTDALGDLKAAEVLHARAARIYRSKLGPRHPKLAQVLHAWGETRQRAGDAAGAIALLEEALAIKEAVYGRDSQWAGETMAALGLVESEAGRPGRAQELLLRAVGIAIASGEKEVVWDGFAKEAAVLARAGELTAAVFFAKRSVNLVQEMRSEVAQLERPVDRSFLARREGVYRELLDWLIGLGRLSEAEEVMTMLKEEEYFDFVRPALRSGDAGGARASPSAAEVRVGPGYEKAISRLSAAGLRFRESTGDAAAAPREELHRELLTHAAAMRQVIRALATARTRATSVEVRPAGAVPEGVADLRYLVTASGLRIVLTTAHERRAFRTSTPAARLNHLVFALRQALQDPRTDAGPPARALHEALLGPVEPALRREHVVRLWLTLDGTLRLVPFAALHDGHGYLVQRYAISLRTLPAASEVAPAASGQAVPREEGPSPERLAAFGTTHELPGFPPLPQVAGELRRIVRSTEPSAEGVVPGVVYLDEEFTRSRLTGTLADGYPLIHIATHFLFRPGPLDRSFLLLGDGTQLTLEQMKRGDIPLRDVRLLALSACSTALGEGGDGRELESFAVLAHRMGAREVMGSLWQVADPSTAVLMARFYAGREQARRDDALALAAAQRSFLEPATRAAWGHPFYWAAFLILGSP
jgi:CHAT domain-containing protein